MVKINKKKIKARTQKVKTIAKEKTDPRNIAKASKMGLKGFIDFIRTQGVIGLAVGLVLGGALSVTVKSLVDNVIMPPLGILLGSTEGLRGLIWTIQTDSGEVAVQYGLFLNDFVNFLIIAFVVYVVLKLLRLEKLDIKK